MTRTPRLFALVALLLAAPAFGRSFSADAAKVPAPHPIRTRTMNANGQMYLPGMGPFVFRDKWKASTPVQRQNIISKMGIKNTALMLRETYLDKLNHNYKVEIPREEAAHIRDQAQTGRCWQFATTTMLESNLLAKGGKRVDLSESFVNYYAWKTRADAMLNKIAKTKEPGPLAERGYFGEGGDFAWASQMVRQHGIVPQSAMPDTRDGSNTAIMMTKLSDIMAAAQRDALKLPKGDAAARKQLVDRYRGQVDALLGTALGKPPEKFTVDGKSYTPETYAKDVVQFDPKAYVVLTNSPTSKMGYDTGYKEPGSLGFKPYVTYNVSAAKMQEAVKNTIDKGQAVWFSTHVGADAPYITPNSPDLPEGARNVMNLKAFDYKDAIGDGKLAKRDRMNAGIEEGNHAMAFVGYDYAPGKPSQVTKLKVDNSWGTMPASPAGPSWDGHMNMYPDFFKQYVDEVVVPRSALPADLQTKLEHANIKKVPR